jgi:two-component system LytT family sensor kinase
MRKSIIIFLHIGFWLCYSLIILILLKIASGKPEPDDPSVMSITHLIVGVFYLPQILAFYTFYFVLFPKYLLKKKVLKFCLYGVLACIVASFIGLIAANIIRPNSVAIQGVIFPIIPALIAGVVGLVIRGFVAWYDDLKLKQELTEKNNAMEMALVKAQLDPHFLFNTLNNIDVLIQDNAEEASKYLNKLSDIMRFMLFETKIDKIDLEKEIEYLKKYIDLQKIRSSNPNFVQLAVHGNTSTKKISPMVFIPFIENAFKHVANKKAENAIEISIHVEEHKIQFQCGNNSNTKKNPIDEYNGLGNELIQKRLNLIYPNTHNLTIENEADYYKVILAIDYD